MTAGIGMAEFTESRSLVCGTRGVVATSQPAASFAALRVLEDGGNAVDAAIAASVLLGVLEPMQAGPGGDVMALVFDADERRLIGLDGSGRAGRRADPDCFTERIRAGDMSPPAQGIRAVTVPGAVRGWLDILERYGTMDRARILRPAIDAAGSGFAVAPQTAQTWAMAEGFFKEYPDSAAIWSVGGGRAPRCGERFANPALARSLREIADGGAEAFYGGAAGREIVALSERSGGFLTDADLAEHRSEWVEPLESLYRGRRLVQMPPNTQGAVVSAALGVLERLMPEGGAFDHPAFTRLQVESVMTCFMEVGSRIADRGHMPGIEQLVSAAALDVMAERVRRRYATPRGAVAPAGGDTAFVAVADSRGGFVALMASLFVPWGSGVTARGSGILLQNRGHGFSLEAGHPNRLGPGKKPRHTILPAMMLDAAGMPCMAFGFVGGDMQVQAQLQFLCNLIDGGMGLQRALDAPRWRWEGRGMAVAFERRDDPRARALLEAGFELSEAQGFFGGGQAVAHDATTGSLMGASDLRRDGTALAL